MSLPKIDEKKIDPEIEIQKNLDAPLIYVSLEDCIDIALENNLILKRNKSVFQGKYEEYKNALSDFLPQIGLRGYATVYSGDLLVGGALLREVKETALLGGAYISHDLTQGGRKIFEAVRKNNLKKAEYYRVRLSENEVLYETATRYYNLLEAKLIVQNCLRDYYEREIQYEIVKAQYEIGTGEKFDMLRGEIELKDSKNAVIDAVNNFKLNQARLCNTMNVEILTPLMPTEKEIKKYELVEKEECTQSIYLHAIKVKNSIKALEREIMALKNERNSYYTEFIPKVDVNAQYSYQGTARLGLSRNVMAGVNVEIPIGTNMGLGTATKIKELTAKIKAKEYELKQEKLNIKENIFRAFANSDSAEKQIKVTTEQFELTKQSTDIAEGKLFEGLGILLDVIQAQSQKTRTNISLSRAKIKYNISQVEILFHGGLITKENILKNYSP